MIIEKVSQYWTEEEELELFNIRIEQNNLIEKAKSERENKEEGYFNIVEECLEGWNDLAEQANKLKLKVEERYIKDRKTKGLLGDVKEIVEAMTKEDYLKHREELLAILYRLQEEKTTEATINLYRENTIENYDNCYNFFLLHLRVQLNGLEGHESETEKALAIVEKKVSRWYVKPYPSHLPIPYSKPTDALAFMSQKRAEIDKISGDATINRFSVQLRIEKFKDLKASLGVSTDKLLSTALATFARNNDMHKGSKTASNRKVVIPLRDYAKLLGYDVEEHETGTQTEAEAEKKRVKNVLDNVRKKTKKDMDILYNLSFEWEEVINKKIESFSSIRLLTAKEYKGGNISITFTPEIADYLVQRGLVTQYNTGLYRLDERKPNAYYIMRKLEEHFNMDANQRKKRHDRISIRSLLEVTELPSFEEVEATDRGHWERRIKEPLEENLDYLTKEKLLKNWEYGHEKGIPLTEEEAQNITDYNTFSKLYLYFTPAEKVDHTERRERREKEIKEKAEKAKKASTKKNRKKKNQEKSGE